MIRTRYAPSPTGYMHIGNLRSALFSYLIAKHNNGKFILRIEDTNQNRYELGAEEFIYKVLDLFNLKYDEGPKNSGEYAPYVQSERLNLYKKYAEYLVKEDYAYYCFCSKSTLNKERMKAREEHKTYIYPGTCRNISSEEVKKRLSAGEKYVIRQKMPREGTTSFHDLIYGDVKVENKYLDDNILLKSDGYPTYNFANVLDDALMNITHVTRGNEYLASTPKYIHLYDALRYERPEFVHFPLVLKKDRTKISKRNQDDNLIDLLDNGFLPEAILNYVAFIGWSPKNNKEFFTLEELVKEFDILRISKKPGCYDIKKLKWYNRHYIRTMKEEDYLKFTQSFLEKSYDLKDKSKEWIRDLVLLYKNQISFGAEIVIITHMFFKKEYEFNKECANFLNSDLKILDIIKLFKEEIIGLEEWNREKIKLVFGRIKNTLGVDGKLLYLPIRILISGVKQGPDLIEMIYLLGKEDILRRINLGIYFK